MSEEKKKVKHHHDKGYRRLLSFWKIFKQLMEGFVNFEWTEDLDYEKSERIKTTFVSKEYEEQESDILYKVPIRGKNKEIFLYILIEHQARVNYVMPLRVNSYLTRIWEEIHKNTDKNKKRQKGFRLPPVFAVVLYNGERSWTAPQELKDIVEESELFGNYIPNVRYHLVNVGTLDPDYLIKLKSCLAGVFLLDGKIKKDKLKERIKEALDIIFEEEDHELRKAVVEWVLMCLFHKYPESLPVLEEIDLSVQDQEEIKIMIETIPEKLIAQGEEKGRIEGKIEGLLETLGWTNPELAKKYEDQIKSVQTEEELTKLKEKIKAEIDKNKA